MKKDIIPKKIPMKTIIMALEKSLGLISPAADMLGVSGKTLYRWVEKNATLAETIKQARERTLDRAEVRLIECVNDKQPWAVSMILKTLGKTRGYVEKQEVEHSGGTREIVEVHIPVNGRGKDNPKTTARTAN